MITPVEIKFTLDRYVIGQDRAKRTLAIAVASHYQNIAYEGPVRINKANLLLLGPTGVGKTFLCQTVARLLDVPFASINATAITPAGWMGDKPWTVVEQMYVHAKQKYGKGEAFKKARTGIVYVDEIDKLALRTMTARTEDASADAKFNTVQIQQGLLRVIEGSEVIVDGNALDTSRILFIASGAFIGLDAIVRNRYNGGRVTRSVGLPYPLREVRTVDFVQFGFIPEFIGRFPVNAALDQLTESEMVSIIRDAEDGALAQKRAMLSTIGCTLDIDELPLRIIARDALAEGTGARGIQTRFEKLLEPYLFDLEPNMHLAITETGVAKRPVLVDSTAGGDSPSTLACASEPSTESVPLQGTV